MKEIFILFLNKKNRKFIFLLITILLLVSLVEIIGIGSVPIFVSIMIDSQIIKNYVSPEIYSFLFEGLNHKSIIIRSSIFLFTIFLVKNLALSLMNFLQGIIFKKIKYDLTTQMFLYYLSKNYEFFTQINPSVVIRILTQDISRSVSFITELVKFTKELILGFFIFFIIFFVNSNIAISIFIILGMAGFLFVIAIKKYLAKKGKEIQMQLADQLKIISEAIDSIKDIIIKNKINFITQNYNKKIDLVEFNHFITNFINSLPRLFLEIIAISAIIIITVFYTISETDISLMIPLLSFFAVSAIRLIPTFNILSTSSASMKYLYPSLFTVSEKMKELEKLNKINLFYEANKKHKIYFKNLIFENVSFCYSSRSSSQVIKKINFELNSGDKIGIYGESGSGKSTFVDILMGLLEPNEGSITINNSKNLNEVKKEWHQLIGYVPQTINLADDTIANNIAFATNEESIDYIRIKECIDLVQLSKFIDNLPEGINTLVGNKGIQISGGERQRLGLARALYSKPEIIILDEATSSLDKKNEEKIVNDIFSNLKKVTIVTISHNLNTLKFCNKVFVMENGLLNKAKTT